MLGWSPAAGKTVVLAGLANYEDRLAGGAAVTRYEWGANGIATVVPADASRHWSAGAGDIDGDGDLDLLSGGG